MHLPSLDPLTMVSFQRDFVISNFTKWLNEMHKKVPCVATADEEVVSF